MADILHSFFTLPAVLDQLLGLEEALEVSHLPSAHHQEDTSLSQSPPQDPLVSTLTGLPEPLLPVALVVLLLGDLLHLVQQLPHPQLQLGQLLLLGNVGVVDGVLANLVRDGIRSQDHYSSIVEVRDLH